MDFILRFLVSGELVNEMRNKHTYINRGEITALKYFMSSYTMLNVKYIFFVI